jgi:shikimate dehydrogenase
MSRPSTFNFRLGLIGYPLSHSLSPKIHAAALKACGLDGGYSLFPILPNDKQGLKDLLHRVRIGEIHGLNVTIPHKQNVISLLDEMTPVAQAIGAVNTIYLRNKRLIGDNTDAPGFLADLKRFLATEIRRRGDLKALVLGAGGSARAIVYALLGDGWKVTIAAHRIEQAKTLAQSFTNYHLPTACLDSFILHPSSFILIVNTTPLGMSPNVGQSPWPENIPFPNAAIYDLVYNLRETKLVKDARAQGLSATAGLGMLIEQAALAFEIWTSHNPPRDVLWKATEK